MSVPVGKTLGSFWGQSKPGANRRADVKCCRPHWSSVASLDGCCATPTYQQRKSLSAYFGAGGTSCDASPLKRPKHGKAGITGSWTLRWGGEAWTKLGWRGCEYFRPFVPRDGGALAPSSPLALFNENNNNETNESDFVSRVIIVTV